MATSYYLVTGEPLWEAMSQIERARRQPGII
jgi:hypothetical protein